MCVFEEPEESPSPSDGLTTKNPSDLVAKSVAISMASVVLSTAQGKNTIKLSAIVKDAAGNNLDNQDITWESDNAAVAAVDNQGVVTAVKDGLANITVKVGELISASCAVTVDSVAPTVKDVKVSDYKTILVTFNEKVTGTPKASVVKGEDKDALSGISAAISEDGMSVSLVTSAEELEAATYKVGISGITDLAGNELQGGSGLSVEKEKSVLAECVAEVDKVPAAQSSFKVYYKVKDQYKQTFPFMDASGLEVSAKTEGGMPLNAKVLKDGKNRGYVEVYGSAATFAVGRKITITMTNKVSNAVSYTSEISVSLVEPAGLGVAASISELSPFQRR